MSKSDLDSYDRAILKTLERNGRITVTELADRVGLSKTPCQIRMKRLESRGYIRGYAAIMDYGLLDTNHIAFVQVKLSDTRAVALQAFYRAVAEVSEIEECHMMAADFDYILKVRTKDIASYRTVLGETISELPYVASTSTFVCMEAVKEHGQLFD
ncbi:MAG TPA: Lrp/AsnC ligand binding domain-containing protein [Marinobacterium sp.]|nr:Lrp/AsnC ligand binding domain-containing protein [Marinobacterium sp.]